MGTSPHAPDGLAGNQVTMNTRPKPGARQVRLKPADSFDLIRLLARSQHDPRKAVCELVQNSLDAHARHVEVLWFSDRGVRALRVTDDGAGIFPDLPRDQALDKIARTIGHSYKRSLTPEERRQEMLLGKYGIGLLGFWSIGQVMDIRTRVSAGEAWVLRLREDHPEAEIDRSIPRRLVEPDTFTQITIRGVHEGAARQIRPPRMQSYLASELRGQLLRRAVELVILDRVARGTARKVYSVEPKRFRGKLLEELEELAVPERSPATVELYLLPPEEESPGRVTLACGGATVLDDMAEIDGVEAPRAPWNLGRLEGVIDHPDLSVAPGTRRGFQRDAAALAFLEALAGLERELILRIAADDRRRDEERHQNIATQIRRAFVSVATALPEYDIPDVRSAARPRQSGESDAASGAALDEPDGTATRDSAPEEDSGDAEAPPLREEPELFPPGPLATVLVAPPRSVIPPGARKRLTARALDRDGRGARGEIRWTWSVSGPGQVDAEGARAHYIAGDADGEATVEATAVDGALSATGRAAIETSEAARGQEKASGIPEPHPVHAPLETWRSRLFGQRWEFNTGHRDYLAVSDESSRRFRYLVHLFAKELVLRNFAAPQDAPILERMVEVLTHVGSLKGPLAPRTRGRPAGATGASPPLDL